MTIRRALIVANGTYAHSALRQLESPAADAGALAGVLSDPAIGDFFVETLHDLDAHEIQAKLEDHFLGAGPEDILLFHFSGHGLKNENGQLFFAAHNTKPDRLGSTSIPATFVQTCMRGSRARTIIIFLDCCYGGAFHEGVAIRSAGDVNSRDFLRLEKPRAGRGRAVISASTAVEYAFEGEKLVAGDRVQPSPFTAALVRGLATGDADRDRDGLISLNELYDYIVDEVKTTSPHQTPTRDIEMQGDLYLARSLRASAIGAAMELGDSVAPETVAAVLASRRQLLGPDLERAQAALQLLRRIASRAPKEISEMAILSLRDADPVVYPAVVEMEDVMMAHEPVTVRLRTVGPPIARPYEALASDDRITVEVGEGLVVLRIDVSRSGYLNSQVVLRSTSKVVTVPVTGYVRPRLARFGDGGLPRVQPLALEMPPPKPIIETTWRWGSAWSEHWEALRIRDPQSYRFWMLAGALLLLANFPYRVTWSSYSYDEGVPAFNLSWFSGAEILSKISYLVIAFFVILQFRTTIDLRHPRPRAPVGPSFLVGAAVWPMVAGIKTLDLLLSQEGAVDLPPGWVLNVMSSLGLIVGGGLIVLGAGLLEGMRLRITWIRLFLMSLAAFYTLLLIVAGQGSIERADYSGGYLAILGSTSFVFLLGACRRSSLAWTMIGWAMGCALFSFNLAVHWSPEFLRICAGLLIPGTVCLIAWVRLWRSRKTRNSRIPNLSSVA